MSTTSVPARQAYDAVIIGSGPNGLTAGIALAEIGLRVLILEGAPKPGGGMRSSEMTRPGFMHDECSAVHPMGRLSPYWSRLPLAEHGLRWRSGNSSAAHPLLDGRVALLKTDLEATCASLGDDGQAYRRLMQPFLANPRPLFEDLMVMSMLPRQPFAALRFGLEALYSAETLARKRFKGPLGQALLAGCAAHSILSLDQLLTGAVGLIFCLTAHCAPWPVVEGGSQQLTEALVSLFRSLGGEIRCQHWVRSWSDLPEARIYLFDTAPRQVLKICGDKLPKGYSDQLARYRYGPGVFKLDFALREPIPWSSKACHGASTVHVGGTLEQIAASEAAMFRGELSDEPFVMVCQQSELDPGRAPQGQATGYAYIHVPGGCEIDCSEAIIRQIERFAPGFRDCILEQVATSPAQFEAKNPAFVDGSVAGGIADWRQFVTRPVARLDPYSTPNPQIYLCSTATPPGGGVHGMGGYFAARSVARRAFGKRVQGLRSRPMIAEADSTVQRPS